VFEKQFKELFPQHNVTKMIENISTNTVISIFKNLRKIIKIERFTRHSKYEFQVVTISSGNQSWTDCVACQIREYAKADILIGLHGAGANYQSTLIRLSLMVRLSFLQ